LRAGAGAGDDEVITVKLGSVPLDVVALFFTVNVFTSGKNFNDVQGECVIPLPSIPIPIALVLLI